MTDDTVVTIAPASNLSVVSLAATGRNLTNPHWALGDFDYNGFVDDADVTLLSALYDPSAEPLITPAPMGVSAVPEPGTVALMIAGLAAVVAAGTVRRKPR